ncbi:MAG: ribulose-phosphate 3-epimerase [Geminicoccaceae bacterium]
MPRIAASILASDFARLGEDVRAVAEAGADWIHLDVMDGRFVPNISFGADIIRSVRGVTDLPFDCHLMVEEPGPYLGSFVAAGVQGLTVHAEACRHLDRTLQQIAELGVRTGLAINPATPACVVEPVLDRLDLILVMTVNPGFGGQKLIPHTLEKLRRIAPWARDRGIDLQVDGGINAETALSAVDAGADVLVAGSAIFGAKDYAAAIRALRAEAAA